MIVGDVASLDGLTKIVKGGLRLLLLLQIYFNPSGITNDMSSKVWDEITYPLPNFTLKSRKSNIISHVIVDIIN